MVLKGWDPVSGRWIPVIVDTTGILKTKPEGVYLLAAPDLDDGEQHRLLLTQDGKLKVDDPTTQAAIADLITRAKGLDDIHDDVGVVGGLVLDVEDKLDDPVTGLAALEGLVDELEPRLVTGLQTGMLLSDHLLAGNIMRNPDFETGDATGWAAGGTGSWSVQNVTVKHGTWAADLFPDALNFYTLYGTEYLRCYPGQRIRWDAWLKADANIVSSWQYIAWCAADRTLIANEFSPNYGGNYDWAFRKLTLTAPDGAYFFRVLIRFTAGALAGHGYVDSTMVPRAPMDGEIHEYAVHVSEVWPDLPSTTCTVTSGVGVDTWGAWANLVDSLVGTLSAKFAASDGYLASILIEECDSTDNMYTLELRDNVTGLTLARQRFAKANIRVNVAHQNRIRSIRIPAGADIEYRMMDATGGKTALLHVRYYLV